MLYENIVSSLRVGDISGSNRLFFSYGEKFTFLKFLVDGTPFVVRRMIGFP